MEFSDRKWPQKFKYQKAGSRRLLIFGGNGAENCITWCENQLAKVQIINRRNPVDKLKATPECHVREWCSIL